MARWAWRRYLLPQQEKDHPAFRDEVRRLSVVGLKAIVWICFGGPAFMLVATAIMGVFEPYWRVWGGADFVFVALGLLGVPFFRSRRLQQFARPAGLLIGLLAALTFIVTAVTTDSFAGAASFVPYNLIVVMLVAITTLPLRPLQTFGFGASLLFGYASVVLLFPENAFVPDVTSMFLSSLAVVILIGTGLTAGVYHQRAEAFQARQEVVRAQAKLALAESAAAQGRLAAALSHELNSPIGVVRSSLDTLALVLRKYRGGELPVERMAELLDEMKGAAGRSTERLAEIVDKMQRFTHLDRAEEANVDVNAVLADTLSVLGAEISARARVTMRLGELPPLRCRPAQLSALFSNLLLNSVAAVGENGAIEVRSSIETPFIVVEIEDNGCGIPKEKLDRLFEPTFRVTEGRISTTNWGLFNCRSIATSLGGEIEVESTPGSGTLVRVAIPASPSR